MNKKITQLLTLFLFLIGIFQVQGQLYSGVPVSDVGSSNSIGTSSGSKSVVVGNDGSIYVVFSGDAGIRVAKSTNRGQSYLPSVQVSTDSFESEIAISSNGTIYVAWSSLIDGDLYIATSTDGGVTFSAPNIVGSSFSQSIHIATMGSKVFLLPQSGNIIFSNLSNGVGAFSALSTNTSFAFSDLFVDSSNGTIYLMGDTPNVTLFKSTDDGMTFNQINLSTNIDIFYSSFTFSNGSLGAHVFVGGTDFGGGAGTNGYKINLNDGAVTDTPLMNCVSPQGRTLLADQFGDFVDGYDDGTTLNFRVSHDQGTTWQPVVSVASGTNLNLARNQVFQDIVALYRNNNSIFSSIYAGALINANPSGIPVSDVGTINSIGYSSTTKSVVVGNNGTIYAVFNGDAGIRVAKSTNRGQSYLPSVQVSTDSFESEIAISSNGTIYVAWSSFNDGNIYIATSTDGGVTFSTPNVVGSNGSALHIATMGSKVFLLPQSGNIIYSNHTNGVGAFSALSTNTGFAYSDLFVDSSNGTIYLMGDTPNVTLFKSTDDGLTFSQINLSTNINIFYSSFAFSNGCSGAHVFVGGTDFGGGAGTNGYKINLNDGVVTSTPLMNCVSPRGRTLIADEFGDFVDGYDDGTTLNFRVSHDQGTTWQPVVSVASGTELNLARNQVFQDIIALYRNNNSIFSNVYAGALITGNPQTPSINNIAVSACDTYTWQNNGQTYTISGIYAGTTVNCVTEVLNLTIQNSLTYYLDADNDGFGNPAIYIQSCVTVPGYVLNNTDCNDAAPTVYPGAPELCYDGLDNNCNGTIDEGCTPIVSVIQSTQCGVTLATIDQEIFANLVAGAQGYRFRVTNIATNQVQTIDRFLRVFRITQLPVYAFNTSYKVEVAVKKYNVWQPFFGSPCSVSTPSTTTQLQSVQCGGTLTAMANVIYANLVPFATGYRFRVTNLVTSAQQVLVRSLREFRMNLLTNPSYNATYSVEVAIRNTDGTYLPYGPICNITTPSFPTSEVQGSQCDYTALSNTETIYANSVSGATVYRFRLTNAASGYSYSIDRNLRTFTLVQFPGLQSGTTYTIQVSLQIGGIFGPFGKACSLTTPGVARQEVTGPVKQQATSIDFKATAYPNPFASDFKLNVTTSSDEKVQVRVYDMLGKLIENKQIATTEIENLEVGASYPSGVYNVIISQGENIQTLRVIKR